MNAYGERREARGSMAGGVVLVALGALFFAREVFSVSLGAYGWPLFIIGPGALLFAAGLAGGRGAGYLLIPGSIVTTIGGLLFVQNLTDYYESWAYAWALIPTAFGVGLMFAGAREGRTKLLREGRDIFRTGLIMLVAFTAFFEGFIFRSSPLTPYLLPLGLIVGGAALVLRNALRARRESPFAPEDEPAQPVDGTWPL